MTLNECQAGHDTHQSKLVDTEYGPFHIWDWKKYQWQGAYCTGQDEVSKSIDVNGYWEKPDTDEMLRIFQEGEWGNVLDFGSHIGWFTCLALAAGNDVHAIEADPENTRLMADNVWLRGGERALTVTVDWTDKAVLGHLDRVRLIKVDIEGRDHDALKLTRHLWQDRKVDYGLWELSPIFEKREGIMADSYAALVDEIADYGYRWYILKGDERWYITGADLTFPQENAWAERLP